MAARNKDTSLLAAAQSERGRDPSGVIANDVVERIVSNSSKEFQDYLASISGGNAMAAANAAVADAPPMPAFDPSMMMSPQAAPMPPVLSPTWEPPAMGGGPAPMMAPPPMLSAAPVPQVDPALERTLRYLGLI